MRRGIISKFLALVLIGGTAIGLASCSGKSNEKIKIVAETKRIT